MRASVIIPTYNGARKISGLLDSLTNQTVMDFEVIIVVDGSTDNTKEVIAPYSKVFDNFQVFSQQNSGRSSTRNKGVLLAKTDLLIFCDDDMLPDKDSIAKHVNFHTNNPGCLLCGSQLEIYSNLNSDIQNYKAHISKKWLNKYANGISMMDGKNLFFSSANCSMPIEVFNQLSGFDERLTDGEDFDLAFRALKKNKQVYFDKNNRSIHQDKLTCVSYIKRVREYADAKQQWDKLHSSDTRKANRALLKKFMYAPFASRYWVKAIDRNLFLAFSKTMRYKFYDIVIQALAIEFPKVRVE